MNGLILIVGEPDLASLIEDLNGWENLQVRYLSTYKGGRYFNVHLSKKQVAKLGTDRIKATYQATEYKAESNEPAG